MKITGELGARGIVAASRSLRARSGLPSRAAAVGLVIGSVVLAGCSGGTDADAERTDGTTSTTAVDACAEAAERGRSERTIDVGGTERDYLLYVPEGFTGTEADLIVNLHGSGSNAEEQLDGSRLEAVADQHGFLVVAPEASLGADATGGETDLSGGQWNVPGSILIDGSTAAPGAQDDVAFIEAVVTEVSDEFCVDRVFSTGTSGGGRMSSTLACSSELFDGVAPVAGLRLPEGCDPPSAVDVVAFHGTADTVNGYLGGGLPSWGTQTVPEAAAGWAALQNCSEGPRREPVSPSVQLDTWSGCDDDGSVSLYTVEGGGHTWPGGVDATEMHPELASVIGVTTQEIDAGQLMWEHFNRQ